jgi:hypothetical protein
MDAFGSPGTDFTMADRALQSGDHIFTWNGYCIMWEDKNYNNVVSREEVQKGLRDFAEHQECEVLVFVSACSGIYGHESNTNLDICIPSDIGRLVIYVSNFRRNIDLRGYVRSVIQPIILSVGSLIRKASLGLSEDVCLSKIDIIKNLIPIILKDILTQERMIDDLMRDMRAKHQLMRANLTSTRVRLAEVLASISDEAVGLPRAIAESILGEETEEERTALSDPAVLEMIMQTQGDSTRYRRQCKKCGGYGHIAKTCKA